MRRLAVGLEKSPVHSKTPTARTTCSGLATLCIWAKAEEPVRSSVAKRMRWGLYLIGLSSRLDAICWSMFYLLGVDTLVMDEWVGAASTTIHAMESCDVA